MYIVTEQLCRNIDLSVMSEPEVTIARKKPPYTTPGRNHESVEGVIFDFVRVQKSVRVYGIRVKLSTV